MPAWSAALSRSWLSETINTGRNWLMWHLRLGGARPKFLYTESGEDGFTHYLVKLSSKSDKYPVIRLEAACLRAAQACGIETPACRLERYDDIGVDALSIVRFDVTPEGGRRHMVSLKTLMHAEYYYSKAYTDIL